MKTIKQWLKTLPEPLRSEAMEEAKKYKTLLVTAPSLSVAIMDGFTWSNSQSGSDFWDSFWYALHEAEQQN